jgi:hypothetical protein
MDWIKIFSAVFMLAMLVFLWPRAKHMLKHSPKGSSDDWKSLILPIGGLILFVVLLVMSVR